MMTAPRQQSVLAIRPHVPEGARGAVAIVFLSGLYVVLVPSLTPLTPLDLYNDKRFWQIGLLLAAGAVLLASRSTRRQWIVTFKALPLPARLGLGVVLGMGVLSAALAPAPSYAFLEVGHLVLLFVLAGVVATVVRRSPRRTGALLLGAVVLSAFLYAVHFAVSYGLSVAWPALEVGRGSISGFANIRHFNQYQTWTLPLLGAAVLAIPARQRVGRGVVFFLAALWWTLVLASNVRGTVVALGLAAVGVGLLFRTQAVRWLGVQAAALLAGAGLYFVAFHLVGDAAPQLADRLQQIDGGSRRFQHWATCIELLKTHPWLGVGPMHFAWPPFHFASGAHPHNAFLQWLAEWGLPSTIIMSGLVVWGGGRWMRQEQTASTTDSEMSNAVRVGLVAAVLAGTAHAMVSGLLVMPVSQVLLALVGGWAWGRYRHDEDQTDAPPSVWVHAIFGGLLLGSMLLVGSSLRDLSTIEERRSAFLDTADRSRFSPRYWAQGYIGLRDTSIQKRVRLDR